MAGGMLVVAGGMLWLLSKAGVSRFPGDMVYRRGSFSLYAPLGLSLALSIIATILLNLFWRR
ncbi:MAG: DUF2905 domain-containing protein [Gemmataceae bacterium]